MFYVQQHFYTIGIVIYKNKIDQKMNELVIDKRIFLQTKKRSNTKTMLPEIKYPLNFNMNGSSILRRINQQIMGPKQNSLKSKTHQQPLSNILISKRITPINPEQSPNQNKRKQNNSHIPKQESIRKMQILQAEINNNSNIYLEDQKRKTSTSLSQRININIRNQQKNKMQNQFKEDIKNLGKKNQEYSFVIGKANNNQDLVRQILAERKVWKEIKWGESVPHLKWVFSKQRHNYKKMWSFTQTRAINHFQFNEELTTKDNLIRNLQLYCQTKKMQIFTLTPITFIIDFDDEYCQYNIKQFLSFFLKNDPRKNLATSRKNVGATYNFVNKFQPYMAWQNSDIKKKVNILSRPVNNATYYSSQPQAGYVWLLKPTGLNRGRGIEIFDNLDDLQKLLMDFLLVMNRKNFTNKQKDKKKQPKNQIRVTNRTENKVQAKSPVPQKQQEEKQSPQQHQQQSEIKFCRQGFKLSSCSFVIQKYVQRPFLIQKRKFDIRVWTLLTHNLHLYFFKQGYIRTSAQQFKLDDIHNYFIHLTNNAIQKNSASYGLFQNGNQLSFRDLNQIIGEEQTSRIWERMKQITYMAYSSVNKKINQNHRKFCFQIFGLDFIIDDELKVWLIQINQNPCIQCASPLLGKLIPRMINDAFKLTIDQIFPEKKPTQKVYAVPGYTNSQNMWQLLGQLGPNAEYSPQKQQIKQQTIRESLKQHIRQVMRQPQLKHKQSTSQTIQMKNSQQQSKQKEQQVSETEVLILTKSKISETVGIQDKVGQ